MSPETSASRRFSGKTALVTGSSRGIGRAIAAAFSAEGAGVVVTGVDATEVAAAATEFHARGADVLPAPCDVRDRAAVDRLVESAVARWGKIDVLVNNAAVFPARTPFLEQTYQEWNDVLQVNVMGAFHVTQAVARTMTQTKVAGRIVNVSSLNSTHYRPGATGITQYGASKAALDNMTKGWALELAPHGITVNGVALGFVRTGMAADDGLESEEFARDYLHRRRIPLGRVGTPEDVAQLVLFLASGQCTWLTGDTIRQDGGLHVTF
jgi:NAD(P)-dependent dehydrogenase (short-subunit alcohol dehydrogenase family)